MAAEKRFFQQSMSEQVVYDDALFLHEMLLPPQELECQRRRQKLAAKISSWECFLPGLRLSGIIATPFAAYWLLQKTAVVFVPALLGWSVLVGSCLHLLLLAAKKVLLWAKNQV